MNIRDLNSSDWDAVARIYGDGIATGNATFETQIPSWNEWDKKYLQCCRLVAELDNEVIGFAVLSKVSNRSVYKGVAEVSVYVDTAHQGKGVGKKILKKLIEASENAGFWSLQAGIFPENTASIALHESCGFRLVGIKERIGKLNGVWYDNYFMERRSKIVGIT